MLIVCFFFYNFDKFGFSLNVAGPFDEKVRAKESNDHESEEPKEESRNMNLLTRVRTNLS